MPGGDGTTVSSQALIPALRDLPPRRLAARTEHLRSELRSARRPLLSRRRALALAAFVLAVLATLLATPAVGLRDQLRNLFSSDEPPPEVITRYFANQNVGPGGLNPAVIPGKTRVATAVFVRGFGKRVVWVAPTRRGGFCSTDLCDSERKMPLAVTLRVTGPTPKEGPSKGSDVHVLFEGDTLIRRGEAVVVHFEDGRTERVSLRWVPKPIDAGFFIYELPKDRWDVGKRPVRFTVEDARGNELARNAKGAGYFKETQRHGLAPPSNATIPQPPPPPAPPSQTYSDPTGDALSSMLDIKSVTITERDNGFIDFLVTLAGDFEWSEDGPLIALDLDQNPDTGSAFYGTEVELVLQSERANAEVMPALYRANGWDFRRERHARAAWTLGPHEGGFQIKRSSLGLTKYQGFNIVVGSVSNHPDMAPDFGTFNYQRVSGRKPPRLGPDRRAPKVLAYDSTGVRGRDAELQYWVLEGRGRTRQVIRIFRGPRLLQTVWTPLADANPFGLSTTTWKVPSNAHGDLRYCVRSFDAAGNRSNLVCAGPQIG
jgi:hypothetical protein